MQVITKQYEVYKYEELPGDVQDKAIENLYDINIDYEWWDYLVEDFKEDMLDKYGISFKNVYFDLDRGSFLYLDKPCIEDARKFLKAAGCDLRKKGVRDLLECGFSIETNYYGGGNAANYVSTFLDIEGIDLTNFLNDILEDFRVLLSKEYDYQTSREAIEETIKINEYDFTIDGKIF